MNEEIWKDIKDYEGLYQISNLGNVKSLNRNVVYKNGKVAFHKGKLLIPKENHGYLRVSLSKENIKKEVRIHRLVAEAFIPNPENKPFVNHLDENRKNNNVSNLEWATQEENFNYSKINYLNGIKKKLKKVVVIKDTGEINKYDSVKECIIDTGISDGTLYRVNGKIITRGKFKGWCFKIVENN